MSRSSTAVLTFASSQQMLLLLFLLPTTLLDAAASTIVSATTSLPGNLSCSMKVCTAEDMTLLNEYVTGLAINETSRLSHDYVKDIYENNEVGTLPFGELSLDWSRLLLLQNRQPEGTPLRENLFRLSRLLLAAYFYGQEDSHGERIVLTSGDNDGSGVGVTIGERTISETEFEEQQANNVTLGSTVQKGSTWINASSEADITTTALSYNNEKQPVKSGNFSGNENNFTTTSSHYVSTLPVTRRTNFNQTLSTSDADNEQSGNKTNETLVNDNEDESGQSVISGHFFASSTPPPLDQPKGDKRHSNEEIIHGDRFASTTAPDDKSSENSKANEAIHERSKEENLAYLYLEKDAIAKYAEAASDKNAADGNRIKSHEKISKTVNKTAEILNPIKSSDETDEEIVGEKLTKSFEDLFAGNDGVFNNNNNDTADVAWSMENDSSFEFNSTKSIEDFFASLENTTDKQNADATKPSIDSKELDFKSHEETQSAEIFFAAPGDTAVNDTDESTNDDIRNTSTDENFSFAATVSDATSSILNDFFNVTETKEDKGMSELSDEARVEEAQIPEKSKDFDKSVEINTNSSLTIVIKTLISSTTMSIKDEDFETKLEGRIHSNASKNETLNSIKLISSKKKKKKKSPEAFQDNGELNSLRGHEYARNYNPTRTPSMDQLISGRFSIYNFTEAASRRSYSNEITSAFDSTTLENGKVEETTGRSLDRSTKYLDTTTTSIPDNTTERDNATEKTHRTTSEIDEGYENRTNDDLFSELTSERSSVDDWNSAGRATTTKTSASIELDSGKGVTATALRYKIPMLGQAATKDESSSEDDSSSYEEEDEDAWKSKGERPTFNPSASSANQRNRRSIYEAWMNKRKSRKRASEAELLDVERQYRTFSDSTEPRQTQFAEKRLD